MLDPHLVYARVPLYRWEILMGTCGRSDIGAFDEKRAAVGETPETQVHQPLPIF